MSVHKVVLDFVYVQPGFLINNLQAIKKYYDYLLYTRQRKDHPCKHFNLKEKYNKYIQHQDLFKEEELELLLERKERYKHVAYKNQVIIGLLIYQGLSLEDIVKLRVNNINLEEGTIYIKATSITHARTLFLKPRQIMHIHIHIHNYLQQERPILQDKQKDKGKGNKATDSLILTWKGTAENGE